MKKHNYFEIRNIFFQTSILIILANMITEFMILVFHILVGRYYGPSVYGKVTTFISYFMIATFPVSVIHRLMMQKKLEKESPRLPYIIFDWIKIFFHFTKVIIIVILSRIFFHKKSRSQKSILLIQKNEFSLFKDKHILFSVFFSFSLILISNIDMIYVKKMFSAEEAGLYGAWSLYARIPFYIFGSLLSLAFIYFSDNKQKKHHEFFLSLSVISLILLSVVIFLIFDLYRTPLLYLIFGKKYMLLYPFMDWAGIFGATYFIIHFFMNYYLANGSKKTLILPFTIPIYTISILIFGGNPQDVMKINVIFCSVITGIFFVDYFFMKLKSTFFN